jgi:hypothetical protein
MGKIVALHDIEPNEVTGPAIVWKKVKQEAAAKGWRTEEKIALPGKGAGIGVVVRGD